MPQVADSLADLASRCLRSLPPRWRERVKNGLGALGHAPGWAHRLRASRLARAGKRLDRSAGAVAAMLATARIQSLRGAACLEFGSGHLLSEAFVYHLLGAARVVAVDRFPLLQESRVGAVFEEVDEEALVASLAPFAAPGEVRERYRLLAGRRDWNLAALAALGITYRAPYDAAQGALHDERFDLIASCAVLEHVPGERAPAILAGLAAMLAPGGTMVHAVHLEDHRDIAGAPFAFLEAGTDWTPFDADTRGNRLRASDWLRMARALPGTELVAAASEVAATGVPAQLDSNLASYAPDDLRTRHLTFALRRNAHGD